METKARSPIQAVRGSRSVGSRRTLVNDVSLVKIDVDLGSRETVEVGAGQVAETYFEDYAGIVCLDDVEVLRREKFRAIRRAEASPPGRPAGPSAPPTQDR